MLTGRGALDGTTRACEQDDEWGSQPLGVFEGRSVKTLGSLSGHGGIWLSGVFYGFLASYYRGSIKK